jgi:hypothetical protein
MDIGQISLNDIRHYEVMRFAGRIPGKDIKEVVD